MLLSTLHQIPQELAKLSPLAFGLIKPPPTANGQYGDRWKGITVKLTKPDKTSLTLGPFVLTIQAEHTPNTLPVNSAIILSK